MRRRLLVVLVPLAVLLVGALGVPLAATVAQREIQETYVDRLNDAGRFASLAESALSTGRTEALTLELRRYYELYGIPAAVLGPDGAAVLGSGQAISEARAEYPELSAIIAEALAGYRPEPPAVRWPWDGRPLIVAEPVGRDSEVIGVVVTVSPTDRTRSTVLTTWGQLAGLGVVPLAGLVAVAWPVSGWILRPVRRLDDATAAIAKGDLATRADAAGGPAELRRLAGSFNAMMDAVERALQRQRAFVSDASHQLRNPLTSLRLAVESLEPYLSRPDAREAHAVAVDEAKSMHRMLNALLAAARMDSVRNAEPVDLDTVLATRVERWRALAAATGMQVQVRAPDGIQLLEPPGGLGSVLDEVVSNALRLSGGSRVLISATLGRDDGASTTDRSTPATEPGASTTGRRPAPITDGGAVPTTVELTVADDGAGLSPDERERALHRFWRSPRHQNTAGTGLGLAICADLVEAAGGSLTLRPGLPRGDGHGLAAVIMLPAAEDADPHDADPRHADPDVTASGRGTTPSHRDAAG
ncbi:HAMP domain-containing sensor histidine kinase [Phytoactinopolyspora halotolerans]|uniref:Signal transduction histidine-protein kinase/phosphatase MprB n=1 Tax=Phytoactinopolyspora halotolerans TaxID=1981512 RepID=A0A6L9SGS2_9ACTN|nr:HAMP domain-containing sensor histidine kinase [Phytoactinopolyspora halotolerans]NEE04337.1 HAMP domain-containing histidine kinase [Phytoactinopolyspora halotolerans]